MQFNRHKWEPRGENRRLAKAVGWTESWSWNWATQKWTIAAWAAHPEGGTVHGGYKQFKETTTQWCQRQRCSQLKFEWTRGMTNSNHQLHLSDGFDRGAWVSIFLHYVLQLFFVIIHSRTTNQTSSSHCTRRITQHRTAMIRQSALMRSIADLPSIVIMRKSSTSSQNWMAQNVS